LRKRHLERLSFQELRRALQALSSVYVERRSRLASRGALDSAGKRAAYALFYAPLHFLLVTEIVRALGQPVGCSPHAILDLGCGTGSSSAAWALGSGEGDPPRILGIDESGWALGEARWNWRRLGVKGRTVRADLSCVPAARAGNAILAAFTL